MNRSCLDHRLTDEERQQFQRDGYFVIEEDVPLRTWLKANRDESLTWSHR